MRLRILYIKIPTVQGCSSKLTFQSLAVAVCTSRYFQKFYIPPTEYLYLLYVRKNIEAFPIRPSTTGFYNG